MVIMKNALWKDIFRDINKSKGRFFSIASIIALGVMLFAGVKIAPIDMKATADKYYDDYNLMDLRVVSTLGLTDEDVKDIKNIEGVLVLSLVFMVILKSIFPVKPPCVNLNLSKLFIIHILYPLLV